MSLCVVRSLRVRTLRAPAVRTRSKRSVINPTLRVDCKSYNIVQIEIETGLSMVRILSLGFANRNSGSGLVSLGLS